MGPSEYLCEEEKRRLAALIRDCADSMLCCGSSQGDRRGFQFVERSAIVWTTREALREAQAFALYVTKFQDIQSILPHDMHALNNLRIDRNRCYIYNSSMTRLFADRIKPEAS